jgi:nitrite reductase/ring-hydroxylating ferredoxin subunit
VEEKQTHRQPAGMTAGLNSYYPVAAAASLAPGEGRTVHLRGREYALFNLGGAFHAMDNECPHRGGPLGAGTLDEGRVHCPLHGWAFDPKTGECTTKLGCAINIYPTRIENGEVSLCPIPNPSINQ